jgi:hypothetical protein
VYFSFFSFLLHKPINFFLNNMSLLRSVPEAYNINNPKTRLLNVSAKYIHWLLYVRFVIGNNVCQYDRRVHPSILFPSKKHNSVKMYEGRIESHEKQFFVK